MPSKKLFNLPFLILKVKVTGFSLLLGVVIVMKTAVCYNCVLFLLRVVHPTWHSAP